MPETFYDVLGVDPDANVEEIRRAYRDRVKETHPDVSDDPDTEAAFMRVKRAKEVLTDESERERYDRLGHEQYVESEDDPYDPDRSSAADASTDDPTAAGSGVGTGDATGDHTDAGRRRDGGGTANTGRFGRAGKGDRGWNQSRSEPTTGSARGTGEGTTYATRTDYREQSFDTVRVPLTPRSIIQITVMFVFYPVFVAAAVFPAFPTTVNLVVGLCTLFLIAYLMSIPEVAIVVFGGWSVLTPLLLVGLESLSVFSLVGIIALVAAWFPLGLAFLTRAAVRS